MDKTLVVVKNSDGMDIFMGDVDRWGTNEAGQNWVERDNADGSVDLHFFPTGCYVNLRIPASLVLKKEVAE